MTTWKNIDVQIGRGDVIERRLVTELSAELSAIERRAHIGVLPHGTITVTIECQAPLEQMARLFDERELYNDCRHALAGDLYGWTPARCGA